MRLLRCLREGVPSFAALYSSRSGTTACSSIIFDHCLKWSALRGKELNLFSEQYALVEKKCIYDELSLIGRDDLLDDDVA